MKDQILMSSPTNYLLIITEQAQTDLEDILLYTLMTWGEEQEEKYAELLDNALQNIQSNPNLGRKKAGLSQGYRLYHIGRHQIAYRLENHTIFVSRILHDRMNPALHIHQKDD